MKKKTADIVEKIFDKTTSKRYIHEGVLAVENTDASFSWNKGYGGKEIDSPIVIASITKMYTTACLLRLQEDKILSLDEALSKYFDRYTMRSLHIYKGKEYSYNLTIGDLLFQMSGLPDIFEEGFVSIKKRAVNEDFFLPVEETIELTKKLSPHFVPGTVGKSFYADINFDLLGEILQKATGMSLVEVYKRYIFEALELTHSYLPETDRDFVPVVYYNDIKLYRPLLIRSNGASGGIISNTRELLIFLKAFFTGKLFNPDIFKKLASYNRLQLSMTPLCYGGGYMYIPLNNALTLYGGKGALLGHSGSTGSFAFYYPEKDFFFVGDFNQWAKPTLPVQTAMRLALQI